MEEGQLRAFARFAEQRPNTRSIDTDLALAWAQSSRHGRQITAARRVEVLRPFLRYCVSIGQADEIPPLGICGPGHRRLAPHIYTDAEIQDLLNATANLLPLGGLRAITYYTLFGLLAVTGARLSEALGLQRDDVDMDRGILTVRQTKFRKPRLIPIHATTTGALRSYDATRRSLGAGLQCPFFIVSVKGGRLPTRTVENTFERLRDRLTWTARGGHPRPRLHDLRHSFVCRALLRNVLQSSVMDSVVDAIGTYVGHVKVSDTYWYLSATPEMMAAASDSFESFAEGGAR
jgi:integrase